MGINDFINVALIDGRVPDALWINNHHWAMSAAVQTSCFIDPHFALTRQAQIFATSLSMLKKALSVVLGTTVFTVFTLVQTKE